LSEGGRPSPARLYSLVGVMVLLWALNFIVAKIALREFPALLAGSLRFVLAAGVVVPVYLWNRRGRSAPHHDFRDRLRLLLLGCAGVGLNQMFFILGINNTSVAHASLLLTLTPLWVLTMSAIAGHEQFTLRKLAGFAVAAGGVGLLQATPGKASTFASALGDLFILLSSVTFAIFTVAGKRATQRFGSLTVNTYAFAGSSLLISSLVVWRYAGFSYEAVSRTAWASLVYMAIFPSLVCYLIFYYALAHIPATRISSFSYLQPLLATALAVPLLGEPLTASLAGGGLLIVCGVFLSERG